MWSLIALVFFMTPAALLAQRVAPRLIPIDSSRLLRIELRSGGLVQGRMVRQTPESLTVRGAELDATTDRMVSVSDIAAVSVPVLRHTMSSVLGGLGIGFLAGTVVGGLVGAYQYHSCEGDICGLLILNVPFGAIVGAFTGTVVGAIRKREVWDPVWPATQGTP